MSDKYLQEKRHRDNLKKKRPRHDMKSTSSSSNKKTTFCSSNNRSHLSLPIHSYTQQIIEAVRSHQVTILVGETGSGKSTQLPQILLDNGLVPDNKGIVCTQPRRVAAVTIAQKVAQERSVRLGEEVGYSIRFEDRASSRTRIKYATDGVLLRECMSDDSLARYHVVILDEAHERSLQTDILLGLLKRMQEKRDASSLRIIVMSATLQVDTFQAFFQDCSAITIPGRQFPVDILYLKEPEGDYVEAALLTCLQIYEEEEEGGVLVFLPGQEDIESLHYLLLTHLPSCTPRPSHHSVPIPLPKNTVTSENTVEFLEHEEQQLQYVVKVLYASMPPDEQLAVFLPVPAHQRLFILATNIAETSLTISGVRFVVDSGFVKMRGVHPVTGLDMLKSCEVSQSQANQRAGRAGREGPGKCFRLYGEKTLLSLSPDTPPEVLRIDLAQVVLQLLAMGVGEGVSFPWPTPPPLEGLRKAVRLLLSLQAIDESRKLTEQGRRMSLLPLHPTLSHFLLLSLSFRCPAEALSLTSLLSAETLFLQPHSEREKAQAAQAQRLFASREGDVATLLSVYEAWKRSRGEGKGKGERDWTRRHFLSLRALKLAESIRQQLSSLLSSLQVGDVEESCGAEREPLLRCLAKAFYFNIAQRVQVQNTQAPQYKAGRVTYSTEGGREKGGAGAGAGGPRQGLQQVLQIGARLSTPAPYETLKGHVPVHVHPSSVLFNLSSKQLPACVVFVELLTTSKQYMRNVSVVDAQWLPELMPQVFSVQGNGNQIEQAHNNNSQTSKTNSSSSNRGQSQWFR